MWGSRSTSLLAGEEIWGDATVSLPADWTPARYQNVLSGESLAVGRPGAHGIRVAEALRHLPVALLVSEPKEGSGS